MTHSLPSATLRSMFSLFRVCLALCLLLFTQSSLYGFEIHLGPWNDRLLDLSSGTLLLVDPDDVSTKQLQQLHSRGVRPLAWLNLGYREPGRSFTAHVEDRSLSLSGKKPRQSRYPVRFFSALWKRLLQQRIQEITNLGFRGLFLTGLQAATQITDHPIAVEEMMNLCRWIRHLHVGLVDHPFLVIDMPLNFRVPATSLSFTDYICLQGIWYTSPRRSIRPWERQPHLDRWFRQQQIPLLTIDNAPAAKQPDLRAEVAALGADAGFATLPLYPIRSRLP